MRGDRFKRRLPKFIGRISDMSDLFYAEDQEFERIDEIIFNFMNGLYVSSIKNTTNPDYFLRRLENDYGLESAGTIDERINAILIKMRGKKTTTEMVIMEIALAYGYPSIYTPNYENYGYILEMFVKDNLDMGTMIKVLREVTPAHLWIDINLNFANAIKIKTRYGNNSFLIWLCGEHLCGDIPYTRTIGHKIDVKAMVKTGNLQARNYYGLTGNFYAGNIENTIAHAESNKEIIYKQSFGSTNIHNFNGGGK